MQERQSFLFYTCVCLHIWCARCVHVWMQVCMDECMPMCIDQSQPIVFSSGAPSTSSETVFLTVLEFINWARLAGQQGPEMLLPLHLWSPALGFKVHVTMPGIFTNSSSWAYKASTLQLDPFPSLSFQKWYQTRYEGEYV